MSEHPSDERSGGRLHGTWDAALHLLDRQIVDDRGRMVGKVDDVELTERPDGTLEVTGLLLGPPALLPRLSTRAFELWQLAEPHRADREKPGRIDIAHVTALTSAVRLGSGRQGIVHPQQTVPGNGLRRLADLLGQEVALDGDPAGVVIDARVESRGGRLVVASIVAGAGRPGSLLGYDRRRANGPAPVARVVAWLHRHSWVADAERADVVWASRRVEISGPVRPLLEGTED